MSYAVDTIEPRMVWKPTSVGELLAMTRQAETDGLAVIPWGGGTHMDLGFAPVRYDVALDMTGLKGVVEYHPDDLVLTVLAGTTLAEVDEVVRPQGLRLALDPPWPERATVGGVLAANASGPLRHVYGTARDLVLGMKVALTGGTEVKGGGRVVKNVSGYDLVRLFVGSLGTLGAIFEATFKLMPRPAVQETLAIECDGPETCEAWLSRLCGSDFAPASVELHRDGGWFLLVGLEGERELVASQRLALPAGGAVPPGPSDADTVLKVSVLPGDVVRYAAAAPAGATVVGAAGVGVLRVHLAQGSPASVRTLREAAQAMGGTLVVERAPAALKAEVDVWGPVGDSLELMRQIKQTVDPHGMFSPGRFVDRL